jgi:tetratricopeptide (TPR) repeat protein
MKLSEYKKAIEFLDEFSSDDLLIGPTAKGAIGDAFTELNKFEDAMKYYTEAYELNPNNLTTPIFLDKAAKTAMSLKKYDEAVKLFQEIKEQYPNSQAAIDIEAKINQAKYSK